MAARLYGEWFGGSLALVLADELFWVRFGPLAGLENSRVNELIRRSCSCFAHLWKILFQWTFAAGMVTQFATRATTAFLFVS